MIQFSCRRFFPWSGDVDLITTSNRTQPAHLSVDVRIDTNNITILWKTQIYEVRPVFMIQFSCRRFFPWSGDVDLVMTSNRTKPAYLSIDVSELI